MKVLFSWLAEFIDLSDLTPQQLAERLTLSGLEVSALEEKGRGLERVVVGRLKTVSPHPNADKLSLTEVEITGQTLQIVCGAKNIAPGDVVPVAQIGTVLPNGTEIKHTKIRGQESHGMICSEIELGIASASAGIMHLSPEAELGTPVNDLLGLADSVLDVEITPNRSDCLSHLGIARHLSAVLDRPLNMPKLTVPEIKLTSASQVRVEVEPKAGCRRYCARVIQNVTIAPSPAWLQRRLLAVGIRPINNVVDITNLVLMEIGHPLHAFDLDRLRGRTISARRPRPGEKIKTLDNVERELSREDLVIADEEGPVALAGVMGGEKTEVSGATRNLLLEAAWFDPGVVRKMSRRTGLRSESSYRFERGTDPEIGLLLALDRAVQLMAEIAGGTVSFGICDAYPEKIEKRKVALRLPRVEKVLGMPVEGSRALQALSRLGFLTEPMDPPHTFRIHVPSFRHDVSLEEDLIEDIAQVIGYDKIPVRDPVVPMNDAAPTAEQSFRQEIRHLAVGLGLTEVIPYSFHGPRQFDYLRLPPDHAWRDCLKIQNPLSEELSLLRTSLLPGLVETVSYNQRRGQERVYIFESGAVFLPRPGETLPAEPQRLGLALTGPRHPQNWRLGKKAPLTDFYDLKGILEAYWERLHVKQPIAFEPQEMPWLHPLISFQLKTKDGRVLGWAGALHPESREQYKLKEILLVAELQLNDLLPYWLENPEMRGFSRYPQAVRDIALAVPEEIRAGDVVDAILRVGQGLVRQVTPFDVYRGQGLREGTKSLAFSLTLQAMDRTLQDEEMNGLQSKILEHLTKEFKAQQR